MLNEGLRTGWSHILRSLALLTVVLILCSGSAAAQVGVPCDQGQFPICDGDCGPDETCAPDAASGSCRCEGIGEACSQCGPGAHFVDACGPFPPVGTDLVADNGAVVGVDLDNDCVRDINLVLGPCPAPDHLLHVEKSLGPIDDSVSFPGTSPLDGHPTGPGLDVIDTEIISLCLTDGIVTMVIGAGGPSALPLQQSLGAVAEDLATPDPSVADSFFDTFFEISGVAGGPLYNQTTLRIGALIDCLPPSASYHHPTGLCLPLTSEGVCAGGPNDGSPCINDLNCPGGSCSGATVVANLVSANHSVNQPVCSASDAPECLGDCPPGQVCLIDAVGAACTCVPLLCEQGPFPECNGDCPANSVCEPMTTSAVVLPTPDLPPEPNPPECDRIVSMYEGQDVHALFPGGIDFSDPQHKCFQNVQVQDDGNGNEIETFDSTVEGEVDLGGGPQPVTLSGPVTIVTYGKTGNTTGTFQTEILSMSLTGDAGGIPIEIRESPSLPSPGQTTITDLGGGQWQIDSFFDVFTELSVAGGPFEPQVNEPGRMNLVPVDPGACECISTQVPCDLSDPAVCDGDCPIAGDICTLDSLGGPCFCAPPPVPCEDTFPVCDGDCPANTHCETGNSGVVVLPDPSLPPESEPADPECVQIVSQYEGQDLHARFPGGVDFSDPAHKCFRNVNRTDDGSGNELETFDSTVDGEVDLGGGPVPVTLSGPVTIVTYGKTGNTTGTFQTEILSMSLSGLAGGIPVEIRESPSLVSPGQTTITDLGGGLWQIDSFFDVFTELSINGGPFQPQTNGAGRMTLVPVNPDICECVPDFVPCDQTDPAVCDGDCTVAGDYCTPDPAGGPCFCAPLEPPLCEDTLTPECDGSCPPNERCVSLTDNCECRPCPTVAPGMVGGVEWPSKGRMRWLGLPCAVSYNVYKLTAPRLTDSDGDGLADAYGSCYRPGLAAAELLEPGNPPSGEVSHYLVTGKSSSGEGSMGRNGAGAERPNTAPCP
ncbi:MAG: hypothetical protein GY716_22525 [bacterium]|nr:hypothetical protein [bacterium]